MRRGHPRSFHDEPDREARPNAPGRLADHHRPSYPCGAAGPGSRISPVGRNATVPPGRPGPPGRGPTPAHQSADRAATGSRSGGGHCRCGRTHSGGGGGARASPGALATHDHPGRRLQPPRWPGPGQLGRPHQQYSQQHDARSRNGHRPCRRSQCRRSDLCSPGGPTAASGSAGRPPDGRQRYVDGG